MDQLPRGQATFRTTAPLTRGAWLQIVYINAVLFGFAFDVALQFTKRSLLEL